MKWNREKVELKTASDRIVQKPQVPLAGCPAVWGHTGSQPGPWDRQQNHVRGLQHVQEEQLVMQRAARPGTASKVSYKICKSIFNLTGSQTWSDVIVSPQTRTRSSCCSLNRCGEVWLKPGWRALQQTSCDMLKIRMSHQHFSIIFQEITNGKISLCFPQLSLMLVCRWAVEPNVIKTLWASILTSRELKVLKSESLRGHRRSRDVTFDLFMRFCWLQEKSRTFPTSSFKICTMNPL